MIIVLVWKDFWISMEMQKYEKGKNLFKKKMKTIIIWKEASSELLSEFFENNINVAPYFAYLGTNNG